MRQKLRSEMQTRGRAAAPDELGNDFGQVGADSAGQTGDFQRLSDLALSDLLVLSDLEDAE